MRELTADGIGAVSGASPYSAGYRAGYATGKFPGYTAMVLTLGAGTSAAIAISSWDLRS